MGVNSDIFCIFLNELKELKDREQTTTSSGRSSLVTAIMTGGTQPVEEAHLTGGKRFCRESSKSRVFYDRESENKIPCRK